MSSHYKVFKYFDAGIKYSASIWVFK